MRRFTLKIEAALGNNHLIYQCLFLYEFICAATSSWRRFAQAALIELKIKLNHQPLQAARRTPAPCVRMSAPQIDEDLQRCVGASFVSGSLEFARD